MESTNTGANLGFEYKMWSAAYKLRGTMDAAEYKHIVLGLIFLKYISDTFTEKYEELKKKKNAHPEDRDEYTVDNVFWVPLESRWEHLRDRARDPKIGQLVDEAMSAVERENSSVKGILRKGYARPTLDKTRLGELIDLISTIGLGDKEGREKDVLGRVYEYFLARFAEKEGKSGGEFYTPHCVVELLVEMIEPFKGRVFDPCCGSGGMFVQAVRFIEAHAKGRKARGNISIYGQEMNDTTWRLAKMNMAIRGIGAKIEWNEKGSLLQDAHKDLKADFILANPPFNDKDWGLSKVKDDVRWAYGTPPLGGQRKQKDGSVIHVDGGNANYAWIQHFVHHLAPKGIAGFVMANGSMSTRSSGEGEIRKALIEADLVDCVVALPSQLFYTTQISVCLWFLTRSKKPSIKYGLRGREQETLFVDARQMGHLVDRTHRELSGEDITRISRAYHAWRGEKKDGDYEDKPGFCKSVTMEEIADHGYVLTPGRYIDRESLKGDSTLFEKKMGELTSCLYKQMDESKKADAFIRQNLKLLGYGK